jgi:hypothetical protein
VLRPTVVDDVELAADKAAAEREDRHHA